MFANPAAFGDLLSSLLAIVSLVALKGRWRLAVPLVWLFSAVGTIDLLNALRQVEGVPYFGATWYIPTFLVPLLLVTHVIIFARLLKRVGFIDKEDTERVNRGIVDEYDTANGPGLN